MAQNPNKLDEALEEVKEGLDQIGSAARKLGGVLVDALLDGVFGRDPAPEPEPAPKKAKKAAKKKD